MNKLQDHSGEDGDGNDEKAQEKVNLFVIFVYKIFISSPFPLIRGTGTSLHIPKPHGRGLICPRSFQRPITQKVLSAKNR